MLTNAAITVFNKFPDKESEKMIYIPHYIERVWFHTNQKSVASDKGLVSADEYKIRIPYPECANWLPSNDFSELSDPSGNWTVQNGDLFIVGEWKDGSVSGIAEIKKKFSGVVGTILSHTENFHGSSQHIRLGGGS